MFHKKDPATAERIPPGQHLTRGWPVLSASPIPPFDPATWRFRCTGLCDGAEWTWDEFRALPAETLTTDIHCVTRWSKLDTMWEGVSLDVLLGMVDYDARYVLAFSDGGYTTNLPVADLLGGKAWVAFGYGGGPLGAEHGGPARLLVPHLYFWKSAKWVRGLQLRDTEVPGFWENYGYHIYGDPWREQRYAGD